MPEIEIGTPSNPIVFTGVIAGESTEHPDNPFYLWNDKGGLLGSVDAKEITVKVLSMNIIDELVGYSNGSADQQFTVAYPPVLNDPTNYDLIVKVNGIVWTQVADLSLEGNNSESYEFDYATGTTTFGNNINGKIPPTGNTIEISYTPDTIQFGLEVQEFNWLGVQSVGVISNNVAVLLENGVSDDTTHTTIQHHPILVSVQGVWLRSDPHRLGTNYFTGGTFNANTGQITLGTALPDINTDVLVDYTYTIQDDAEADYSQVGQETTHTFLNPLPSNNAKQVRLRLKPPATASPSGFLTLQFRIRLSYKA